MIGIINCQMRNIAAFVNIYKQLNIPAHVASIKADIDKAEKLILPGVGAFDWAMQRFNDSGLRPAIEKAVVDRKIPVLGICIGMHMLARGSEEGRTDGLGWIDGTVKRLIPDRLENRTPLPHMGWNKARPSTSHELFNGLEQDNRFYFLHSYYFAPGNDATTLSTTNYGSSFTSAICNDHIHGVQFHPEKSHGFGIKLLQNFAEI